jgi:ABC-type transport system involved in cytochrome c biogenesis permease subunit
MEREQLILWIALVAYVGAGCVAIFAQVMKRRPERSVLALLILGLLLHTLALALRWERLGHGPFVTMYEILSSNIWSLALIYTLASLWIRQIRPAAALVMPVLFLMMGWMMMTNPGGGLLPSTYNTIWLYIHIGFGKIFFGSVLVALGLSGVILSRALAGNNRFARMPDNVSLEELAYRFLMLGLIFDTLMLMAGAIWARDAWGRYWSWAPLESWSLMTWIFLALAIHLRLTLKPRHTVSALLVVGVFALGFLTFFGIPFITQAPHKGMV